MILMLMDYVLIMDNSTIVGSILFFNEGGSVVFDNDKFGTIIGIGKISESLSHSIDNVYLVDGLQHNLLSVFSNILLGC